MTEKRSGLGRGLSALIPEAEVEASEFRRVPVAQVHPNPSQPRKDFDTERLEELAASIREVGILQPIVVRASGENTYTIVAGERRFRAAKLAELPEIPILLRTDDSDVGLLTEALIENVQREDLGPLEVAAGYKQLLEDFGLTHEQVASRVGKSRPTVTNAIRLLQLPASIQGMLERGELAPGHARPLLTLDDSAFAAHIAEKTAAEGWSVRQVEEAVRARVEGTDQPEVSPVKPRVPRPAAMIELEERLSEHLGSRVKITYGRRGGRLVVGYRDLDDLERIYRRFFGG